MKITEKKAREREQETLPKPAPKESGQKGTTLYELRGIGWNMKRIADELEKTNKMIGALIDELIRMRK